MRRLKIPPPSYRLYRIHAPIQRVDDPVFVSDLRGIIYHDQDQR